MVRDWSLITGRGEGGSTKREGGGGAYEGIPLRKRGGGAKIVLVMLKGGGAQKVLG